MDTIATTPNGSKLDGTPGNTSALNQNNTSKTEGPTESKKTTIFILIFLAILCLTLIGFIGYMIFARDDTGDNAKDESGSQSRSCSYNDETYQDGEEFAGKDGCGECICNDGTVDCSDATCTTTAPQGPALERTLQELMNEYCVITYVGDVSVNYIDSQYLPFSVDETKITLLPHAGTSYEGHCVNDVTLDLENKGYILLLIDDGDSVGRHAYVYDETSEEPGHGGPQFLGQIGEVVDSKNDYALTVYLECGDMCAGTTAEYSLSMRARKILEFRGGEKIYINTDFTVFETGDSTLQGYLSDYIENPGEEVEYIDQAQAEAEVVQEFFADVNSLSGNPKTAYDKAMNFLNAIDFKD